MKKNLPILFVAGYLFLKLLTFTTYAQNTPAATGTNTKDIVGKLQTFNTDKVIEKAYLHLDKLYYDAGDTIYFKAYVTSGEQHVQSVISGILHVDLVNKNDSVIQSRVLQLNKGLAWGDLSLPSRLPAGNYRIRAYTRWMQNTGRDYVFDKILPVNSNVNITSPATSDINKPDVQFFPEGGSFVADVPCRFAFKAIGSDGLGIAIKGGIVDNTDKEITKIITAHLGMGQFFITPEAGKTYKAKINYPNGTSAIFELPKPDEKGLSIAINNDKPDKLSIDINANKLYYLANKNQEINMVIYNGGIIKTVRTILDNQVIGLDLPKKDLKSGIIQITIFSQNGVPLNERIAFIMNNDLMNLSLKGDKELYKSLEKSQITLNAKNFDDKPVAGNLSVAVVNEKVEPDDSKGSGILSYLLLTTDVKGYVEQPDYYFSNMNTDTRNNLDILMLTQGYRRFTWNELLKSGNIVNTYQPENGLQISGVMKFKNGKPVSDEAVTLLMPETGQSLTVKTNPGGRFVFDNIGYNNDTRFLLKTENEALKNKTQIIMDKKSEDLLKVKPYLLPIEKTKDMLADLTVGNTGTRVYRQANNNSSTLKVTGGPSNYHSSNLSGPGHADQVIKSEEFKGSATLTDGLNGRARGVIFKNGTAYLNNSLVVSQGSSVIEPMTVVVDGSIVSVNLDTFSPNDIDNVEILKGNNATIYGIQGGAGVLIINTNQGGGDSNYTSSTQMAPGLLALNPSGFYKARQFYQPKYDVVAPPVKTNATVYWKPDLVTDKDGNASFNFQNASQPGTYRITVEGMDAAGNLGRMVFKYKVQ